MRITYYSCEPSKAQEKAIECLNGITVRPTLHDKSVVVSMTSFQQQTVKMEIDEHGIIKHIWLES